MVSRELVCLAGTAVGSGFGAISGPMLSSEGFRVGSEAVLSITAGALTDGVVRARAEYIEGYVEEADVAAAARVPKDAGVVIDEVTATD